MEKKKKEYYILKKEFETDKKKYEIGDRFSHINENVINFLKSKNII